MGFEDVDEVAQRCGRLVGSSELQHGDDGVEAGAGAVEIERLAMRHLDGDRRARRSPGEPFAVLFGGLEDDGRRRRRQQAEVGLATAEVEHPTGGLCEQRATALADHPQRARGEHPLVARREADVDHLDLTG